MNIKHDEDWIMRNFDHVNTFDLPKRYAEHYAAPLLDRIAELGKASKKYNFYTEQAKDLTDTDVHRVWISEAASKHPASAYIDAMPSSGKLFINIALTGMTTPEDAIEFAELVKFAAGLLED